MHADLSHAWEPQLHAKHSLHPNQMRVILTLDKAQRKNPRISSAQPQIHPQPRLPPPTSRLINKTMKKLLTITVAVLLCALPLSAQKKKKDTLSGYDRSARATVLHDANVYVTASPDAQRIALVTPGHEVVIAERSTPWVRVFANTDVEDDSDEKPDFAEEDTSTPASGWIRDKGVVSPATPNGDRILFGAAAAYELAASEPHAPKGAAMAAHLLYARVADYFPTSTLAGEAAWRSADVRWQTDKADISTLPSAREQDASLRPPLYDKSLKKILKLYPGTKYAAYAAYDLLDTKLCGEWQGLPHCPELESNLYEKYAAQFPDGPRTAQALYNAVYRQGVLVSMYNVEDNKKRAEAAAHHAQDLNQQLQSKFPQTDDAARSAALIFKITQQIPIYGNDRD